MYVSAKARRGMPAEQTPRSGSFCTHTIQQRTPMIVDDARLDPRYADSPLVIGPPHIRSYAGVPLRTSEGYNVGALCAMDTNPRSFSPAEIAILTNFATIVCDELELRMIAQVDHLTGALTRRGFLEQAEREIERARRYARPGTLVMFDIDHFKTVNDSHGHAAGDQVLHRIAGIAEATLRPSDLFGRLGGEEFALLMPETNGAEAVTAADRLRRAIADHPFHFADGAARTVTASFGVAELPPGCPSIAAWLQAADIMLYAAKSAGRNCIHADSSG